MKRQPGIPEVEPERYELSEPPAYRFDVARRDFFKALGGGIAIIATIRGADAAPQAGARRSNDPAPPELSAWIHIEESGKVRVFSGKAEVGQNARTSLTQVAAEELRIPASDIEIVLADTDLTPFDQGTFGSRTTPIMVPLVRKAAASAREVLIDLAAERWAVARSQVTLDTGILRNTTTGATLRPGDLTRGQKLQRNVTADIRLTPTGEWRVAGRSAPKVSGRDIVTGRHKYTSDLVRPGMLTGRILRAPAAGSTLGSLDNGAGTTPGVTVVRDGNFVGVAAPTAREADQALAKLRATWVESPQIGEAALFDHMRNNPDGNSRPSLSGSVRDGAAEAELRLSQKYTVAYIAHVPLETRAAVAEWNDGRLTVWTGTQRPFGVRAELAEALRIPESQVRVIVPDTGSGYGGKHTGDAAIEAARLARAAGKPVRVQWSREEEFQWAYLRPAGVIEITSGVKRDGRITSWEFHNYNSGAAGIPTPYSIPNQHIEFHPTKYPLRQGSYRGLAATANHFARESHMDELAAMVKLDPLEFRFRNLKDDRLRAVLEAGAERFEWGRPRRSPDHGIGFAGGYEKGGYISTFVEVDVDRRSGRVRIARVVAAFECGAIINPDHLKHQVEGSIVQGIGGALFERIRFDKGTVLNPKLSGYRVPRFSDLPSIDVVLIDRKDLPPAGAGETPIVGLAPAVAQALFDATGQRLRSLPMAPNGLRAG